MTDYHHQHMDTTRNHSIREIYDMYMRIYYMNNYKISLNISENILSNFINKWVIHHYYKDLIYGNLANMPTQLFWGVWGKREITVPTGIRINGIHVSIDVVVSRCLASRLLPTLDGHISIQEYNMPYCVQFVSHDVGLEYGGV